MLPMYSSVTRCFKSDVVLALAITHHLLLTQGHKIEEIFEKTKSFSKNYVFVEFMPLGLWGGDRNIKPNVPDWYTSDFFENKFQKYFQLIKKEVIEFHVINGVKEAHRILYVGKLK
jgi:hypothetical protein